MNWDRIQGNWKQSATKAKARWGKRTRGAELTVQQRHDWLVGHQAELDEDKEQTEHEAEDRPASKTP